jgi:iron complex outermembrane recepter protein
VIRGPATLLYGNGAIVGIVNVIDNRIPESVPEKTGGALELRRNSATDGNAGIFKLDGGAGSFAWHADGLYRKRGDVRIPGHAILEEPGHEEEEAEHAEGFIENSGAESRSATVGGSFIGERGFIGASVSRLENRYGIPPGAHEHEAAGEEDSHEEESLSIDLRQTRFNIKGGLELDGLFEALEAHVAFNDYRHREIEAAGGIEETGTVFDKEGAEARILLHHGAIGGMSGVLGLQFGNQDFSAAGEEAFIPASDIRSLGLFAVESIDTGRWLYEFGLRTNNQSIAPAGGCGHDETTWSGGASAIRRVDENTNVLISLNRSERSPSVEELFSNIGIPACTEPADPAQLVTHAASRRIEIGNPGLKTESSRNLELALRRHLGEIQGELNLFHNRIDDYIFLADTGDEFEETRISRYLQRDARFSGIETEITLPFAREGGRGHVDLSLFADYVKAEFDGGGNVPRIPPRRLGMEIAWLRELWSLKLRVTGVDDQNRIAANETASSGYTLVDAYFDYHLPVNGGEAVLFIKGSNLLDEEIRNHASLIKDFAPEPGIGFEAGVRYRF